MGTGSSAIRLTSRTATGSLRAMARSTSLTPDGPSARPTADATSAMTESMSMRVYGILPHHARHRRGAQLPATAQAGATRAEVPLRRRREAYPFLTGGRHHPADLPDGRRGGGGQRPRARDESRDLPERRDHAGADPRRVAPVDSHLAGRGPDRDRPVQLRRDRRRHRDLRAHPVAPARSRLGAQDGPRRAGRPAAWHRPGNLTERSPGVSLTAFITLSIRNIAIRSVTSWGRKQDQRPHRAGSIRSMTPRSTGSS